MVKKITKIVEENDQDVVYENAHTDREFDKARGYSALNQFVYLIFGIITSLLLIRFIFRMLGANSATPIVDFMYEITDLLMMPFRFIFPSTNIEGALFEWSVLVAILFYALFAWIIMKLVSVMYTADTD